MTFSRIPVGSFGDPEEVARLAELLAESSNISRQTLNPNGGMYFS
jgi:NAD(P)-dependent dehydrogenase (short-subunit alcohol dehydrogenase family)